MCGHVAIVNSSTSHHRLCSRSALTPEEVVRDPTMPAPFRQHKKAMGVHAVASSTPDASTTTARPVPASSAPSAISGATQPLAPDAADAARSPSGDGDHGGIARAAGRARKRWKMAANLSAAAAAFKENAGPVRAGLVSRVRPCYSHPSSRSRHAHVFTA